MTRSCPDCSRPMEALFYSATCMHCEYGPSHRFLAWAFLPVGRCRKALSAGTATCIVYQSPKCAAAPLDLAELDEDSAKSIVEVASIRQFDWVATETSYGLIVKEPAQYNIRLDHKYPDAPHTAYLTGKKYGDK